MIQFIRKRLGIIQSRIILTSICLGLMLLLPSTFSHASQSTGLWKTSPIDIMGTGKPGFAIIDRDRASRLQQNPTTSDSSYRWYAQRRFTAKDWQQDNVRVVLDFEGDDFHTLELWLGAGSLRSTMGFEKLLETRESLSQTFDIREYSEEPDEEVSLKVILRKDHGVVIETPVLSLSDEDWSYPVHTSESFMTSSTSNHEQTERIKVGAFNIQVFGMSKSRKSDVMGHLVDILTRYDVVFIQEIRDSSGLAVLSLLAQLNAENDGDFRLVVSERMGSTNMKEQYAYFYRHSLLSLLESRTYPDRSNDFERPPYLAHFRTKVSGHDFLIAGIHVDPDEAYYEIDALGDVADYAQQQFDEFDLILLGDLNADCSYLRNDELEELSIYRDQNFTWHISSDVDTTTALSSCAYDRIITSGATNSWTRGASVFRYDQFLRLNLRERRQISDHYPVELTLEIPIQNRF